MPRRIQPVRPRRKDERKFERRLRRRVSEPLFRSLRSGLAEAAALAQAFAILDGRPPPNLGSIPEEEARMHFVRVNGYHRTRLIQTFRAALGVDISRLLQEGPVRQAMEARIAENVGLIKTIPQTLHDDLRKRLSRELTEAAFDRQRLSKLLNTQFKSTGYNLRRLTRDQTTKAIGQFTEIRQRQIGVEEYRWLTSQDERVRPEHVANSGMVFRWDTPPATGAPGEDIMCRCVAIPIITERDRLGAEGPTSII